MGVGTLSTTWQVYEWTRKKGNLKGETWRKIVNKETREVFKSYSAATVKGFDLKKVVDPKDED